jgi:hypothetical protein
MRQAGRSLDPAVREEHYRKRCRSACSRELSGLWGADERSPSVVSRLSKMR